MNTQIRTTHKESDLILDLLDIAEDPKTISDYPTEDTEPMAKAEIAKDLFFTRCNAARKVTGIIKAGLFVSTNAFKGAFADLIATVGKQKADEIASDYFFLNNFLFK